MSELDYDFDLEIDMSCVADIELQQALVLVLPIDYNTTADIDFLSTEVDLTEEI